MAVKWKERCQSYEQPLRGKLASVSASRRARPPRIHANWLPSIGTRPPRGFVAGFIVIVVRLLRYRQAESPEEGCVK